MASGYGSSMLTQSAAHALFSSEENASSLRGEASLVELDRTPVVESRDTGMNLTCFTDSNLRYEKDGVLKRQNTIMVEAIGNGALAVITSHFTFVNFLLLLFYVGC